MNWSFWSPVCFPRPPLEDQCVLSVIDGARLWPEGAGLYQRSPLRTPRCVFSLGNPSSTFASLLHLQLMGKGDRIKGNVLSLPFWKYEMADKAITESLSL